MRNTHATQLIFELSTQGRTGVRLPDCDVPEQSIQQLLPDNLLQADSPTLPEVTEPEVAVVIVVICYCYCCRQCRAAMDCMAPGHAASGL